MKTQPFAKPLAALLAAGSLSLPAMAQPAPVTAKKYRYSTTVTPGIEIPSQVKTRLGTLRFIDGIPDEKSAATLYNNLDFQRAVQAYLMAIPAVSQVYNRNQILKLGPPNTTVPIFESLMDSRSIFLTPNTSTPYSWLWLDLRQGPVVLEAPPQVLGTFDDLWFRWIMDVGLTGPDKGQGGKYLLLPPNYQGPTPDGYVVVKCPTYSVWAPWRSFVVKGDPKPGVDLIKKHTRVYRLSESIASPRPTTRPR